MAGGGQRQKASVYQSRDANRASDRALAPSRPRGGRSSFRRRAAHQARIVPCGAPFVGIRRARARKMTTNWRHTVQARGPTFGLRAGPDSGGVWRPARPAAAWRPFVLIGRFPAVLMPTNNATQGPILAWCAARRRNEPRPLRGLDRARARSGARSRPRGGRCWSGRRAARQARIGPCGALFVGIGTAGNRPERTNSRRAASGCPRHLPAPSGPEACGGLRARTRHGASSCSSDDSRLS